MSSSSKPWLSWHSSFPSASSSSSVSSSSTPFVNPYHSDAHNHTHNHHHGHHHADHHNHVGAHNSTTEQQTKKDIENKSSPFSSDEASLQISSIFTDWPFLKSLYVELRQRALQKFTEETKSSAAQENWKGAVVLQGGKSEDWELYDSDTDKDYFRQEAFFRYIFGINEPDCYGVLDIKAQKSYLFVPFYSADSERWNGENRPFSYYIDRYGVDECFYNSDLHKILSERNISHIYLLNGVNLDSGNSCKTTAKWNNMEEKWNESKNNIDDKLVHHVLTELRAIKTEKEAKLMRAANFISSQAHVYVMKHIQPGYLELQCEALFQAYTRFFGSSRHMAYSSICGCATNGAILHYGHAARPNDRILDDGEFMVLDMGAEYLGYATDITRSYPINGKFTAEQRAIHTAVYESQKAVIKAMKPGVSWPAMHRLSEKVILEHLIALGLVQGSLEDAIAAHIASVFMPHGLGHLLGMNVHDVGGYLSGESKSKEEGLCWLRCGRPLQAGMVITVEPGIYFNEKWIAKALTDEKKAKFINREVLEKFKGFGGCRLEDDVLVTETGAENLTILPTSVDEIEEVMKPVQKK